jgi:hypothetical protein
MIDTENRHLVAVDAGATDPRVAVCMPPRGETLSTDEAITLASHLVAKANSALVEKKLPPSTPRDLFDKIDRAVKRGPAIFRRDGSGRIVVASLPQFMSAENALTLAAEIVAVADPDANMLERVSAVVEAARGGKELDAVLADKRSAVVNLTSPRPAARLAVDDAPLSTAEIKEACEDFIEHAPEAEELRRMRKGGA